MYIIYARKDSFQTISYLYCLLYTNHQILRTIRFTRYCAIYHVTITQAHCMRICMADGLSLNSPNKKVPGTVLPVVEDSLMILLSHMHAYLYKYHMHIAYDTPQHPVHII